MGRANQQAIVPQAKVATSECAPPGQLGDIPGCMALEDEGANGEHPAVNNDTPTHSQLNNDQVITANNFDCPPAAPALVEDDRQSPPGVITPPVGHQLHYTGYDSVAPQHEGHEALLHQGRSGSNNSPAMLDSAMDQPNCTSSPTPSVVSEALDEEQTNSHQGNGSPDHTTHSHLEVMPDDVEAACPMGHQGVMTDSPDYNKWPYPAQEMHAQTALLYDAAKLAKLNGAPPPRVDETTSLIISAWEGAATGHPADTIVINGIKHGFSIQYMGPPMYGTPSQYNHTSATCFPEHVQAYIDEEIGHGALEGPFANPPFTPWFHTSPLMTREKDDKNSRRIIVDLSYPDGGVNAQIPHHTFDGRDALHNLPTITSATQTIAHTCPGEIHLAVIDLSRAYRHFPVTPLDWPLLGCGWGGAWTFDRRLPFGSRMSSFAMQTIGWE